MRLRYKIMTCAAALDAVIVFSAAFGAWSGTPSNPPIPGIGCPQQRISCDYQNRSDADGQSAKDGPIASHSGDTDTENSIAEQFKKYREQQAETDDKLSFFNTLLVVVGLIQGLALAYTALVSNKAANAAKEAAEALPLMERAYIFVHHVTSPDLRSSVTLGSSTQDRFTIRYSFKNHGRTPAIIQDRYAVARYLKFSTPDKTRGRPMSASIVISPGDISQEYEVPVPIIGEDFENAKKNVGRVYFWGNLGYLDIFGERREIYFFVEWDFDSNGFKITEDAAHRLNYYT
jgi:hypothetical protein